MTRPTAWIRIALATSLLAATAGPALAQEDSSTDVFARPRTELGFGMLVGGFSVGPINGPAVGIHIDAGRQFGRTKLYGEYDMLSIGETAGGVDPATRGLLHRGGLDLRYDLGSIGGDGKPIQGTFWLEGGAGREWIYWEEGGRLTRDDVSLGFGAQMNLQMRRHDPRPRIFGIYYAFKATVARAPASDQTGPAICGGPCDEPTRPSPYDLGLYFNLGLQFGR